MLEACEAVLSGKIRMDSRASDSMQAVDDVPALVPGSSQSSAFLDVPMELVDLDWVSRKRTLLRRECRIITFRLYVIPL